MILTLLWSKWSQFFSLISTSLISSMLFAFSPLFKGPDISRLFSLFFFLFVFFFFSLSFIFTLWCAETAKFTNCRILFLVMKFKFGPLAGIRWSVLYFKVIFLWPVLVCAFTLCQLYQILVSCTVLSRSLLPPSHALSCIPFIASLFLVMRFTVLYQTNKLFTPAILRTFGCGGRMRRLHLYSYGWAAFNLASEVVMWHAKLHLSPWWGWRLICVKMTIRDTVLAAYK